MPYGRMIRQRAQMFERVLLRAAPPFLLPPLESLCVNAVLSETNSILYLEVKTLLFVGFCKLTE